MECGRSSEGGSCGSTKLITVSREVPGAAPPEPKLQFLLRVGETLTLGRSREESNIVVNHRCASMRHAQLFVQERRRRTAVQGGGGAAAAAEGGVVGLELCVRDVGSQNGTGLSRKGEEARRCSWEVLEDGSQLVVPYKSKEIASIKLTIGIFADMLPDAYDSRRGDGRFLYHCKLGEGSLGYVYRASDKKDPSAEDLAVKVSKLIHSVGHRLRYAYILHREAQWSLTRLHNQRHRLFCRKRAKYFLRYLGDYTGVWSDYADEFEVERQLFEAGDFKWENIRLPGNFPALPYVTMEFIPGETLYTAMGWPHDPPTRCRLSERDCQEIAVQAAEALTYLCDHKLIHRDFRHMNIMVLPPDLRTPNLWMKVIDFGHTISADEISRRSPSLVVRCNWKEDRAKRKTFDWAPGEVKAGASAQVRRAPNFALPGHAFDVFSLAMLVLQLGCGSIREARYRAIGLTSPQARGGDGGEEEAAGGQTLGFEVALLRRMLGSAAKRPSPREVVREVRLHARCLSPETPSTAAPSSSLYSSLYSGEAAQQGLRGGPPPAPPPALAAAAAAAAPAPRGGGCCASSPGGGRDRSRSRRRQGPAEECEDDSSDEEARRHEAMLEALAARQHTAENPPSPPERPPPTDNQEAVAADGGEAAAYGSSASPASAAGELAPGPPGEGAAERSDIEPSDDWVPMHPADDWVPM